jgi:ABC-type transport system involved in multi-copper enzyme maturation permease subunit
VRAVWIVYALASLGATVMAVAARGTPTGDGLTAFVNAFQYSIGLLLVSVTSVTCLFEERVRGSLDVLLTTPLPTSSIVWGKWWGAYRGALLVMLLPLGMVICLGALNSELGQPLREWDGYRTDRWELVLVLSLVVFMAYGPLGISLALAWLTGDSSEVWRKWWHWYRGALLVVPLLMAVIFCMGLTAEKAGLILLLTALMLAYGAAVTSLGLALATWVKRFGVAVGLSVAIYILVTGGSLMLMLAIGPQSMDERNMAFISPWYGAGELTYEIGERFFGRDEPVGWKVFWGVAYAVMAVVLAVATRNTFDRCMGRVTQRRQKVRYYVRRQ